MEIVILPDAADSGPLAGGAVAALLDRKPDAVLGLATGSSPLPVYDNLVARYTAGEISFARATAFTLDEYVGLPADHPERYSTVIREAFTSRVDLRPDAVHGPDGLATDIPAACAAYDAAIAEAGGIDLQILGIGTDGHIAFNEPGSSLASRTRIKTRPSPTRPGRTTPGSSAVTSTRSRPGASPRDSAPSWRPGTSCSRRPVRTKRKPSTSSPRAR